MGLGAMSTAPSQGLKISISKSFVFAHAYKLQPTDKKILFIVVKKI
jgi:hypothetical protein